MSNPKMYPINPVIDEKLEEIRSLEKRINSSQQELRHKKGKWLIKKGFQAKVVEKMWPYVFDNCFNREAKKASQ